MESNPGTELGHLPLRHSGFSLTHGQIRHLSEAREPTPLIVQLPQPCKSHHRGCWQSAPSPSTCPRLSPAPLESFWPESRKTGIFLPNINHAAVSTLARAVQRQFWLLLFSCILHDSHWGRQNPTVWKLQQGFFRAPRLTKKRVEFSGSEISLWFEIDTFY